MPRAAFPHSDSSASRPLLANRHCKFVDPGRVVRGLVGTDYGRLLLVKIALLAAMDVRCGRQSDAVGATGLSSLRKPFANRNHRGPDPQYHDRDCARIEHICARRRARHAPSCNPYRAGRSWQHPNSRPLLIKPSADLRRIGDPFNDGYFSITPDQHCPGNLTLPARIDLEA